MVATYQDLFTVNMLQRLQQRGPRLSETPPSRIAGPECRVITKLLSMKMCRISVHLALIDQLYKPKFRLPLGRTAYHGNLYEPVQDLLQKVHAEC